MELIEEVRQGLTIIEYVNSYPNQFSSVLSPFFIGLLQLSGGCTAEFTNLFMLATRDSVSDCITFFVAFHVLTAIDNIYAEGIADFALREAVEKPLRFNTKANHIKLSTRTTT